MSELNAAAPAEKSAMITPSANLRQPLWQSEMRAAISDPEELCDLLGIDVSERPELLHGQKPFGLRVPRGYVDRMRRHDPADPLLLQVLPQAAELVDPPGFVADPVGDLDAIHGSGVLKKYDSRVLLITTGVCAIHCRYCFRRHFPYGEENAGQARWTRALETLYDLADVSEVILSGGDPLSLSDDKLAELVSGIERHPRVHTLRVHTRQPVVLPSRVDEQLCAWLDDTRLSKVIVIHANHANELDENVETALRRLAKTGALLLNQSVLLKAVNDSVKALVELSQRLFECGVLPYYLHQLDPVAGAAHFEVPDAEALMLHEALRASLPGYLVPRLVREVAGAPSKRPLR